MPIGVRIRDLRKSRGLKQQDFVGLGISSGYISLIEQGKRNPSPKALNQIASILKVPLSEISGIPEGNEALKTRTALERIRAQLAVGDAAEAQVNLQKISNLAAHTREFLLLEIEIDVALGNFVAAEIELKPLIVQLDNDGQYEFLERALTVYGRASDRLGTQLSALVELANLKRNSFQRMPNFLKILINSMLAARLSDLGDAHSATVVLTEITSSDLSELSAISRARTWWSASNVASNSGDLVSALVFAVRAQETLCYVSDRSTYLRISYQKLMVQLQSPNSAPAEECLKEIKDLIHLAQESNDLAAVKELRMLQAHFLFSLGEMDESLQVAEKCIQDGIDAENEAALLALRAGIRIQRHDAENAEQDLRSACILMKNFPNTHNVKLLRRNLATAYRQIGLLNEAIEVLLGDVEKSSDFSELISS